LSPILVRPVREQLEHDRIIRLLHAKFRRKYEAGMNPGNEQNMPVGTGPSALFPDLVLLSQDRGHKLQIIVEIETGESVNHLEALAQWAHYGRVRAAFHLYIPAGMVDVARRLTEDNQIHVAEIWSYHVVGEEPRFTLVHRNREPISPHARKSPVVKPLAKPEPAAPAAKASPVAKAMPKPAAKPAPKAKAKPAKRASAPKPKPQAKAAPKPKKAAKKKK
jgi:pyruvate/2-oxoglutarate dehydrogenase complex dihydrolipoamide acyltransferase (E2) component